MTLAERVAYLEERVRQMEIEMKRMEKDIAMLLRERERWPWQPSPPPFPDTVEPPIRRFIPQAPKFFHNKLYKEEYETK
jgi:hypothetical protein